MSKIIESPIILDHWASLHRIIVAIKVKMGDIHNEWMHIDAASNRPTSFDSKFTVFPGAVSIKAFCDNRRAWIRRNIIELLFFQHIHPISLFTKKLITYFAINESTNRYTHFHSVMVGKVVIMNINNSLDHFYNEYDCSIRQRFILRHIGVLTINSSNNPLFLKLNYNELILFMNKKDSPKKR